LALTLSDLLRKAQDSLDLAEREFAEGAFAPFWDAVERATECLAAFDHSVQKLSNNARNYYSTLRDRKHSFPSFSVHLSSLPDTSAAVSRIRGIVRNAQKDFHFATIYEQRKTNKLLTHGFLSLGDAIARLETMIESSFSDLASSISSDLACMVEAQISTRDGVVEHASDFAQRSDEQRSHERSVRVMLDNIQRGRKPRGGGR
jgi:hypothetical protein